MSINWDIVVLCCALQKGVGKVTGLQVTVSWQYVQLRGWSTFMMNMGRRKTNLQLNQPTQRYNLYNLLHQLHPKKKYCSTEVMVYFYLLSLEKRTTRLRPWRLHPTRPNCSWTDWQHIVFIQDWRPTVSDCVVCLHRRPMVSDCVVYVYAEHK